MKNVITFVLQFLCLLLLSLFYYYYINFTIIIFVLLLLYLFYNYYLYFTIIIFISPFLSLFYYYSLYSTIIILISQIFTNIQTILDKSLIKNLVLFLYEPLNLESKAKLVQNFKEYLKCVEKIMMTVYNVQIEEILTVISKVF